MSQAPNWDYGSVNALINKFQTMSGFQRSNRFGVQIDPPEITNNSVPLNPVYLFASSIQIPSQVIQYYPDTISPSGPSINIPVKREYDDRFIIDFIMDKNWNARVFFDRWMEYIFKSGPNGSKIHSNIINYRDKITGTVTIYALDTSNNLNKTIRLIDAWPSTILPTQFMQDAPNDYITLTIDMNYRRYEILNSDENGSLSSANPFFTG